MNTHAIISYKNKLLALIKLESVPIALPGIIKLLCAYPKAKNANNIIMIKDKPAIIAEL
jgi:hypothetical protein